MSLDQSQRVWLARFAGYNVEALTDASGLPDLQLQLQVALAAEEIEAATLRTVYLKQMRQDVNTIKDDIVAAFQADIDMIDNKTMAMFDTDQTKAFGWWSDIDEVDMEKLTQQKFGETEHSRDYFMSQAKAKLTLIEQRMLSVQFLRSRIDDSAEDRTQHQIRRDDSTPLFEEADLIKELYTPLVRERLLPETFVEDTFSEVHQMISFTNDAYIEELESIAETAERDEMLALLKSSITATASLVTGAMNMNMAIESLSTEVTSAQKAQAAFEKGIVALVSATMTTSIDVGLALEKGDVAKAAKVTLSAMASSAGFLVTQYTGSPEIGKYVALSMKSTAHTMTLVEASVDKDEAGIQNAIISMIGDGFEFSKVGLSSTDDADTIQQLNLASAATRSAVAILAAARQADIFKAISEGRWGAVQTMLVGISAEASRTAFNAHFPDKIATSDPQLQKISSALVSLSEALEENAEVASLQAAVLAQEDAEKARAEDVLDNERAEFESNLELLGQRETLEDGELKTLSVMIEKLKRDNAIMTSAVTIGSAGFAVAKQFLAPLVVAGTIIQFTTTLAMAIDRAMAMNKWMAAHQEAMDTSSPYMTSIANFVKNQREQFAHKSIQSALLLLQVSAQVTATAGTGSPVMGVATIVNQGLSMATTLEDLTFKFYQEAELRKAWRITQKALNEPHNRKANLLARAQNPTLAKYSIAYGAVVAKDVIAVSALNKIGLTRETLAQEDANVQTVKTYLEELYADDIKVLRPFTPQEGWASALPEPELSAQSWMLSVQLCREKGNMDTPQDDNINRLFTESRLRHEQLQHERSTSIDGRVDSRYIERTTTQLKELRMALLTFKPTQQDGSPVVEMENHIRAYIDLLRGMTDEVSLVLRAD